MGGTAYPTSTQLRDETSARELSSWSHIWEKYFLEGTDLLGCFVT